jgi:hypothetical protein
MASAAFASRKKLELGSETVRKMERAETVGFVTEEERVRVEKINKENEELSKLKKRNFFNGEGGSAPAPSRDDGAVRAGKDGASAASAANSISATTHSAAMCTTTAQPRNWKKKGKGTPVPR